jgi:hypothetical protein
MLELQRRVDKAELKERFYLRRQLDARRKRMKQYRPLQQLFNLRGGMPLEFSEIEAINAELGRPVVLVD